MPVFNNQTKGSRTVEVRTTIEYESILAEVQASDLSPGKPVYPVQQGQGRRGTVEGIQHVLVPYERDRAVIWLDAGMISGRVEIKVRKELLYYTQKRRNVDTDLSAGERIGQDVFHEALMLFWDRACAVTGVSHPRLLRASHIIQWAECKSEAERLDVHNGLLLATHLDAAFDAHLISFDSVGRIMFSPLISETDRAALHL